MRSMNSGNECAVPYSSTISHSPDSTAASMSATVSTTGRWVSNEYTSSCFEFAWYSAFHPKLRFPMWNSGKQRIGFVLLM